MGIIEDAKLLCLERDAHRCRHCGTNENCNVYQLNKRDGRLAWQLSNLISLCEDCKNAANENRKNIKSNKFGVILCGGRATRMYPITKFHNKHVLPIGIVPMIFYPLKTLRTLGVYRALVIVDRESASCTMQMLGSGKEFGMDLSFKIQEGAGGISEALYLAKDLAKPDDQIVCILGDNIFDNKAIDADIELNDSLKALVYLKQVSNPESYGVAVLDENSVVTKIVEKPKDYIGNMAVVGLYVYTYDVFRIIESIKPSERGELEISEVNDHYARLGQLGSKVVSGYWGDAGGSIQRYAECSMHGAKEAKVSAEEIDSFRSIVFDDK